MILLLYDSQHNFLHCIIITIELAEAVYECNRLSLLFVCMHCILTWPHIQYPFIRSAHKSFVLYSFFSNIFTGNYLFLIYTILSLLLMVRVDFRKSFRKSNNLFLLLYMQHRQRIHKGETYECILMVSSNYIEYNTKKELNILVMYRRCTPFEKWFLVCVGFSKKSVTVLLSRYF